MARLRERYHERHYFGDNALAGLYELELNPQYPADIWALGS